MSAPGDTRTRGWDRGWNVALLLALSIGVAAILDLHAVGVKSLWRDEAYSVTLAGYGWHDFWRTMVPRELNGSLYYLLLRGWVAAVGSTESAVRSLSVVFAVAAVPALYLLARRLFGREHAAVAALLLAVNGFVVRYAQEARGYAVALFLVTVASWLLVRAFERPSGGRWLAYALVAALSVYAHFFAALLLPIHLGFAFLAVRAQSIPVRTLAGPFGLIGVLVSPLLVPVLTVSHLNWLDTPTLRDLGGTFESLAGAGGIPLLGGYFVVCSIGLVTVLRSSVDAGGTAVRNYGLVLAWLFVPVLASYLFSTLVKPVFTPRYLMVSLPALVLLGAAGCVAPRPRWIGVALLMALVAGSARGVVASYERPKEDWRSATAYVVGHTEPGDVVAFHSAGTRAPFDYYLLRLGLKSRAPQPVRPDAPWGRLDFAGPETTESLLDWLDGWPGSPRRVWLVLKSPIEVPAGFAERYCRVDSRSFSDVYLVLYRSPACSVGTKE